MRHFRNSQLLFSIRILILCSFKVFTSRHGARVHVLQHPYRQIRSIRRSVPRSTLSTLISRFHMSKLDYCNVALAGLPSFDLDRWHASVINAAARLTVGTQRHDHITPLLADLHWLRMPQRIQYKLCVLVYQCVQGSAPSYLQNAICPVASAESRRHLRSASSADLIVPAT